MPVHAATGLNPRRAVRNGKAARIRRTERYRAMPSTVIRTFDYSPDREQLTVQFVTGRRYIYSQVPPEVAHAMRDAFAKGVYFNRHIRDRYPCRELV